MRERLPGGVLAHTLLTAQRESDGLGLARARERHGRGTGAAVGRTRRAAHRENARRTGVHGYSRQTRWFPPLLTHYNDAPTSAKRPVEGLAVLSPPDRRSLRESVDNPTRARTNCGVELKKKKKKLTAILVGSNYLVRRSARRRPDCSTITLARCCSKLECFCFVSSRPV